MHNLEFFLSPAKEFESIGLLGFELTSPPFSCIERKNPSKQYRTRFQNILNADSEVVNLHKEGPRYYALGLQVC